MKATAARTIGKHVSKATIVAMTDLIVWIRKMARVLCCLEELFDQSMTLHT